MNTEYCLGNKLESDGLEERELDAIVILAQIMKKQITRIGRVFVQWRVMLAVVLTLPFYCQSPNSDRRWAVTKDQKKQYDNFDVLLTAHLSIILVINQLNA